MKSLSELWNDLTPIGKAFSWWIIPVYYLAKLAMLIIGIIFYGIFLAFNGEK